MVIDKRIMKEKHLSLSVKDRNGKVIRLMAFYAPAEWFGVENGNRVRVQFTLTKNEWRGKVAIEGNILSLDRLG